MNDPILAPTPRERHSSDRRSCSPLPWPGLALAVLACLAGGTSAQTCPDNRVANGDFSAGLVLGSMPTGAVSSWSLLSASPQVVSDGCGAAGAVQMWGNQVVGESIQQQLPGAGIKAGRTYRVKVCYRWLDNNPSLPQYVRLRLSASSAAPALYPPVAAYDLIGVTPNTSSTTWTTYTFPDWTAPSNASWLTVNPENDSMLNDGNFVSWGQIDDICITEVCTGLVANGDFSAGLVYGSMPAGSVSSWSLLSASPQVVSDGCDAPGAVQMWGNQVVGESIQQQLPGAGFQAGKTYRVRICYRWLDNNPSLPQYVRLRLSAAGAAPTQYPPVAGYSLIGVTPNTSSTAWTTYTFPLWTAPSNASWLTVNPENDFTLNDGNFVSWGLIDDICITEVRRPGWNDNPSTTIQSGGTFSVPFVVDGANGPEVREPTPGMVPVLLLTTHRDAIRSGPSGTPLIDSSQVLGVFPRRTELRIPESPALIGTTLYARYIELDPTRPDSARLVPGPAYEIRVE